MSRYKYGNRDGYSKRRFEDQYIIKYSGTSHDSIRKAPANNSLTNKRDSFVLFGKITISGCKPGNVLEKESIYNGNVRTPVGSCGHS